MPIEKTRTPGSILGTAGLAWLLAAWAGPAAAQATPTAGEPASPAAGAQGGLLPAPPPPVPVASPPAPGPEAQASRALGDLVRLLVRKRRLTEVDAARLAPPGAGTAAVPDLARTLFARAVIGTAHYDAIEAALEVGGPGAGPRAFAELVRGLYESGELTDGDMEALLSPDAFRRITYVSELTRVQLRELVRREVVDQLRREGWAEPNVVPPWLRRLRIGGDVRVRQEWIDLPPGLNATGYFNDFAAINAGPGFDVRGNDLTGDRYLDVDQDRTRVRLRARVGVDVLVLPLVTTGIRLATGDTSSPVSANQTLGASGGYFSKYALWLDRAWIRVGTPPDARRELAVEVGRFENPFFKTQLVWDENVNLDGAALMAARTWGSYRVFVTGGAFPLYNTPIPYPAEQPAKSPSHDKWLFAGQAGAEWRRGELGVKAGVAFYDYYRVEGRVSSPCDTNLKSVTCDTDDTRPGFAQKGNTYRALRTPSSAALIAQSQGPAPQYQYFGLASAFRDLVGTLAVDLPGAGPVRPSLQGEITWNTGFDRSAAGAVAVNNFARCTATACTSYAGEALGYLVNFVVGSRNADAPWTWDASVGWRWVGSDSTLDAFTDSDFGMGGTNLKGVTSSVSVTWHRQVTATLRWFSADQIAGAPYGNDVIQLQLQARF
jgi:hypothetical protein